MNLCFDFGEDFISVKYFKYLFNKSLSIFLLFTKSKYFLISEMYPLTVFSASPLV